MTKALHQRPLSPHLAIYRWQITNTLSILHRMTGFGLALGLVPLTLWLWAAANDPVMFRHLQDAFASWLGMAAMFGWILAFYYHFANGIRHLNWDMGRGFDLGTVTRSGYAVLVFAVGMTVLTAAFVGQTLGGL